MPTASRAHHVQMLVRLPPSMKRWLEEQASEAGTSVNDEVIRIVRAAMRFLPRTVKAEQNITLFHSQAEADVDLGNAAGAFRQDRHGAVIDRR